MKKLLSFLLSICIICVLIPTAHAAGSIYIDVSASAGSVQRGQEVTFTVSVSGSAEVTQFGLQLSYDSSVFEMVGGSCTISGAQFSDFNAGRGFAVLYGGPTVPNGTVGSFTLRAKTNAAFASSWVGGNASAMNGSASVNASAGGATVSVTCSHSFGGWSKVDENNHKHTCSVCGAEESAAHSWNGGTVNTPANCQTTGEASYTCTGCGAAKTETLPKTDHNYSSWAKVDDSTHKHACSVCGKEETASHSWDGGSVIKAANCISDGEVKYTCTGCGLTRNETVAKTGVHTYDHGCDTDCNICAATRTTSHSYNNEWKSDKTTHWQACVHCGEKKDSAAHKAGPEPTEDTAQTCTVCNYMLKPSLRHEHVYADKLTGDETGHGYMCKDCNDMKDFAAHAFDNECDTSCDTCGYTRTTEHKWDEQWTGDDENHYHACTICGEKNDQEEHDWRRGVCKVCGAAEEGYVPYTMPTALSMAIGAVIGAGATAGGFIFVGKKKKETAA